MPGKCGVEFECGGEVGNSLWVPPGLLVCLAAGAECPGVSGGVEFECGSEVGDCLVVVVEKAVSFPPTVGQSEGVAGAMSDGSVELGEGFFILVTEVEMNASVGVRPTPAFRIQLAVRQQCTETSEIGIVASQRALKSLRPGEQCCVGGVMCGLFQCLDPLPQHCGLLACRMNHFSEGGRQIGSWVGTQTVEHLVQAVPTPFSVLPPFRFGEPFFDIYPPGGMGVGESQMCGGPVLWGGLSALLADHAGADDRVVVLVVTAAADERLPAQPLPKPPRRLRACRGGEDILVQLQRQCARPYGLSLFRVGDPLHEALNGHIGQVPLGVDVLSRVRAGQSEELDEQRKPPHRQLQHRFDHPPGSFTPPARPAASVSPPR